MKSIFWRVVLLGGFTLIALILFLPSIPSVKAKLPAFWGDNVPKIVLGLDLQGGTHLVLSVDREKAVENYLDRIISSIDASLSSKGVSGVTVKRSAKTLEIAYNAKDSEGAVKEYMGDNHPEFAPPSTGEGKLVYKLKEDEEKRRKESALDQALETIRNRIDQFGVAEPLVQKQGENEIIVQLPGIKDSDRAIELIKKTAFLEFRLLDEEHNVAEAEKYGAPYGSEVLYQVEKNKTTGQVFKEPILVKKEVFLTGDMIADARVAFDSRTNEPYVAITFDSNGAKVFERITERNVGKRLAIILDRNVHSAPVIREKIGGGHASISGGFTHDTSTDLAIVLRAGALLAPIEVIQNVTVGASLGQDSIDAGIKAFELGAILVLVFMVVYYKRSGLVADFAVVLNIVMLLGAMAWMNATLTMPGIAGILLTIGMGVDSNVLIFERVKEELRAGRTPRSAINAGYDRAWWTIVDSHVTTLITGLVLFQFGSGPIKGFAVSLCLGILINLFTSLVGTKLIFDIRSEKLDADKISI